MLDFNTEPYNDDFDENNKFYRILFRPSFAVQARELTQLQTILQQQIKYHGSHVFQQGAMVIPGQISLDTNFHYVKLQTYYGGDVIETYIDEFQGRQIVGDSGVTATVLKVAHEEGSDETTLYVRYNQSGDDTLVKTFSDDEVITTASGTGTYTVQAISSNSTGVGSAATVQRGVYYVNGFFVLCEEQTILLDKYTNTPSYRIGLTVDEQKVIPEDDETLLDNAQTSYNYAAPGAHRYFIDLVLTKIPLLNKAYTWVANDPANIGDVVKYGDSYYQVTIGGTFGSSAPSHTAGSTTNGTATLQYITTYIENNDIDSDEAFIELLSTVAGRTERKVTKTAYSEFEKTLARRTYDESGNYTVTPFKIDVREHRNNNRGVWESGVEYAVGDVVSYDGVTYVATNNDTSGSVPPTHTTGIVSDSATTGGIEWEYNTTPYYNRGIYSPTDSVNPGDESKLAIGMEPGKAYVQGYEIEKIATEYVTIDKARDSVQNTDSYITSSIGNYVLVTNLNSLPPFDSTSGMPEIVLYDRMTTAVGVAPTSANQIGTARVRGIEWHNGTIGTQTAVYKLYLFDVSMTYGYDFGRDAKSFYYSRGGSALNFTADISPVTTILPGSGSTYSTYPTIGADTTISGLGGTVWYGGSSTAPALKVGDYIYVGDIAAANIRRVTAVTSNNEIEVNANVTADGAVITLITTTINEPQNSSAIIPLPNYAIKSVTASDNVTHNIIYYGMQLITGSTGNASGGTCSLTLTTGSGVFADPAETDNYVLVYNDPSAGGVVVAPSAYGAGGSSSISFTLPDTYANKDFIAMATIKKTNLAPKTKRKQTSTVTFTTEAAAAKSILSLGKADVFNIKSIKMDTGSFASPTGNYDIDLFDHYNFDDGQRDSFYDIGTLLLKQSYSLPTAPISVTFEWFEHGPGDYFSINSYLVGTELTANEVPVYNQLSLRDVLDFRPRIGDAGLVFSGSGASFTLTPKRGQDITVDYSYYLARKDKIAIDFNGRFFNIKGVSSLTPKEPLPPTVGMVLYDLSLEPYTFSTANSSVVINQVDNKRYTMRDIGKLEKRIDNLEYYTSLSLLEQETKSLSILDANGLDRFKNGFIVDSFTGHNVGNVTSPDYLCSVDMQNGELRPFYTMNNVNLVEDKSTDADRTTAGYKLYGDVITLPVKEHIPLVTQTYASRLENINPFAIFTFLGDIRLNPSSDDWFEVDRRPDIVRNVEGNFNTIAALATEAGILGTVWNAWQILWMGEPLPVGGSLIQYTSGDNWANERALRQGATYINVNEFNRRFGAAGGRTAPARQVFVEQSAQQVGRGRTGVKSTLVAQFDRQVLEDKVVSTAVIPYIRSRNILVQVKGLKPNTRFYPYFDQISVGNYCTPASYITYTLPSATSPDFNTSKNCGSDASAAERIIDNISGSLTADKSGNMCLNIGDRIEGTTSGATAVVIGKDYDTDTDTRRLHVVNIKGTFVNGETITAYGTGSGAIATLDAFESNKASGAALTTNSIGDLNFIFYIPDDDSLKFRTGSREFKLLDVSTVDGQQSSSAKIQYQATGMMESRQKTINSVRNAQIIQEIVAENDVIVNTTERVVRDTGWYDPLAQTFLVQSPGGAFLSKVDIFFASKDDKLPVTLEIRDVVNGYPGKRILPFSKVTLNPSQVNLSTTNVTLTDGSDASYPKYDTPTTFTFPSPVYVEDNGEYCIVLASDSNNYKVWISQMGDIIPASSRTISEQPYAGVLFKSQNASTWTANQDQDLKFTVYRCKFDTEVSGSVQFVNDVLPINVIEDKPFQTSSGSNKVRVWHANHGMFVGSKVVFDNTDPTVYTGTSGYSGTITSSNTSTAVTGIGTSFIADVDYSGTALIRASDNKVIGIIDGVVDDTNLVLKANASVTIGTGVAFKLAPPVNGIPITEIYTSAATNAQIQHTISDVDLDSYCITVASNADATGYAGGSGVRASSNVIYDMAVPSVQTQTFSDTTLDFTLKTTTGKSVDGSETPYVYRAFEGIVPNANNMFYENKVVASTVNQPSGKTAILQATISSTNDALSPIIDTHRTSLIAISNKVNNPDETNINVSVLDDRYVFDGSVGAFSFAGSTITTSNADVAEMLQIVTVGKYITVSGATTTANNGTYLVTGVAGDGATTGTITIDGTFNTNESAVSGTTVTLRTLFVDEIAPTGGSAINKYISRPIVLQNPSSFFRIKYAAVIPLEADVEVYYKLSPAGSTVPLEEVNWTQTSPDAPIVKVENGSTQFFDVDYSEDSLPLFDRIAVKIVMKSTNSCAVPRIKDLRIIACA